MTTTLAMTAVEFTDAAMWFSPLIPIVFGLVGWMSR
jgi:hypothetical protein